MVTVSKEELKKAVLLLGKTYGNRFSVDKELFDVWYSEISGWELSCFWNAVRECLTTCEFPPNLANLKEQYREKYNEREEAKRWYIEEFHNFLRVFTDEEATNEVMQLYANLTLREKTTEGYRQGAIRGKKLRIQAYQYSDLTPEEFMRMAKV